MSVSSLVEIINQLHYVPEQFNTDDMIFVEIRANFFNRDGMHVFTYNGNLFIKRLQNVDDHLISTTALTKSGKFTRKTTISSTFKAKWKSAKAKRWIIENILFISGITDEKIEKNEPPKASQTKKVKKAEPERKLKSVEHFSISYNASDEEYAEHKIDARNLVQIVQDTVNLIERSDKLLNGKQKTVKVYIQALDTNQIVKQGSIQFPFAVEIYEYVQQMATTLTTIETKDVLETIGILSTAYTYGLFKGIFSTKGEPVLDIKTQDNSNEVEIITEHTKYTTDENTAVLMQDSQIRQSIKDLTLAPLFQKKDGRFKIIRQDETHNPETLENKIEETITLNFKPENFIDTLSTLSENVYPDPEVKEEQLITITQLNFSTGKTGWKMKLNGKERNVEVQDVAFMNAINNNQASFRKGDWLKVKLKSIKTFGQTTRTSYIILDVIEHLVEEDRKLTEQNNE